ncbi:MAG: rod shape-determining protein RodA [Spirochaetia bacterium]|nr:rod shape-determining protein RodA [Spirochaetia bacterium]
MKNPFFPRLFFWDTPLLIYVVLLGLTGVLFAYSSSIQIEESRVAVQASYLRQLFFLGSGLALMIGVSFVNYKKIAEHYWILFAVCISLLLYTIVFGKVVNGSRRWIDFGIISLQPSEFVKVLMVVVIAQFLDKNREKLREWKTLASLAGIVGLPILLIFLQPDLGTALVFIPMTMAMIFVGGFDTKYFAGLLIMGTLAISIPLWLSYNQMIHSEPSLLIQILSNSFYLLFLAVFFLFVAGLIFLVNLGMRNITLGNIAFFAFIVSIGLLFALAIQHVLLKEYQRERLLAFLNPHLNKWDFGYNVIQSQITVGSGGILGKGFAQGAQGQLGFLPSRSTDFIFSVIGEELGFLGSGLIVVVFLLFVLRMLKVARGAKDRLGGLIAVGILTKFAMQIFINIGMTIGVAPVTGIPLPFLTYGGSALWTSLLAIGLLFNVDMRRYVHK